MLETATGDIMRNKSESGQAGSGTCCGGVDEPQPANARAAARATIFTGTSGDAQCTSRRLVTPVWSPKNSMPTPTPTSGRLKVKAFDEALFRRDFEA
jgi:hypothetical protein